MSNSLLNSGESQHLKLAINTFSCQDSPPPTLPRQLSNSLTLSKLSSYPDKWSPCLFVSLIVDKENMRQGQWMGSVHWCSIQCFGTLSLAATCQSYNQKHYNTSN